jgi:2-dehydropantoate 2-reductase
VANRSYAIIGSGAVGGFYGARLARAGRDVHFLLHTDYDHVRRHGLTVESVDGDFHLPQVQAYSRAEDLPPTDVVVVAMKATNNHLWESMLRGPVARGDSSFLLLQNGLGGEDLLASLVGPDRVLGGLCFLCSNKVGPGRIHHLDYGFVTLGQHSADGAAAGITDRMRAIGADLEGAGIQVDYAEDLLLARWRKLVWNIPFNGLSVVLDARIDEILACPETRALAESLMGEVVVGAASLGREIEPAFVRHMMDLTERMTPYRTSMKIDHELGRPMEVEAIFGNPLRAAEQSGADLPGIRMLYRLLTYIDTRASGTRHS